MIDVFLNICGVLIFSVIYGVLFHFIYPLFEIDPSIVGLALVLGGATYGLCRLAMSRLIRH